MKQYVVGSLAALVVGCASQKVEPQRIGESSNSTYSAGKPRKSSSSLSQVVTQSFEKHSYTAKEKEDAKLALPFHLQHLAPRCSSGYFCGPLDTKAINTLPLADKDVLTDYLHVYYPEYGY